MKLARLAAGAALVVLSACSGGTASTDELPGPVPENVVFRDPPAGAPPAPAFELDLLGGDALDLTEQWDARPVQLWLRCGVSFVISRASWMAVASQSTTRRSIC